MGLTKRQKKQLMISVIVGSLMGLALFIRYLSESGHDVRLLQRQAESYKEELYVTDGEIREKIIVEVEKEPYTNKEKLQLLETAASALTNDILGENQSLDHVEYPLELMRQIEGTSIMVSWDTDQPMILDWEGEIGEMVPEEGTRVHLRAELVLDDYRKWVDLDVNVFPEKLSESEQFLKDVENALEEQNQKQGTYLHLPLTQNGRKLTWSKTNGCDGLIVAFLVVLIGMLWVMSEKSRADQRKKQRQLEMQLDYPGILNKMILLMQAGVSSRSAFQKLALDYSFEREKGSKARAAYEEILLAYKDMEHGLSEETVYRRFGERCELLCYRTFSTLLVQNLKKGSSYFISALKQECQTAFEIRKSQALIRGEEAGTKLLIPMGCMLLIILLIILVPSMMALG